MHHLLWTFPTIMAASIIVGWAAEVTAVHLSAGIALAMLAWLQTAPEFAVEAYISWTRQTDLILANFTGSLRLLLGVGWPMIFFIHWLSERRRNKRQVPAIKLPESFSIEAVGITIPVTYFSMVCLRGTWSAVDGVVLCFTYVLYFWLLNRQRKRSRQEPPHEDEPRIVKSIMRLSNRNQLLCTLFMFTIGGLALILTVRPFITALKETATAIGISEFVFIQWIAPIASEFPEKVTAFNWARKSSRVSFAIINLVSSMISEWTLLAGLVPIIYTFSSFTSTHHGATISLTHFQTTEIWLTIVQSFLAIVFLADLKITALESIGLFMLWVIQFFIPTMRTPLIAVYSLWILLEIIRLLQNPQQCRAWVVAAEIIFKSKPKIL